MGLETLGHYKAEVTVFLVSNNSFLPVISAAAGLRKSFLISTSFTSFHLTLNYYLPKELCPVLKVMPYVLSLWYGRTQFWHEISVSVAVPA